MFWSLNDWSAFFLALSTEIDVATKQFNGILYQTQAAGKHPTLDNLLNQAFAQFNPSSDFFLRVLTELHKTSACTVDSIHILSNPTDVIALQRLLDEHAMHQRRLLEILLILIECCRHQMPARSIEHFALYSDLIYLLRKHCEIQQNFAGGAPITSSVEQLIERRRNSISNIEASGNIDPTTCRYLAQNRRQTIPAQNSNWLIQCREIPKVFASTSSLLKTIFSSPANSAQERLERAVLGFTYNGLFGKTSSEIHFSPISFLPTAPQPDHIYSAVTISNLLSVCVILRCYDISQHNAKLTGAAALRASFTAADPPLYTSVVGAPTTSSGELIQWVRIDNTAIWSEIINVRQNTTGDAPDYISYDVLGNSGNQITVPATDVVLYIKRAAFQHIIHTVHPEPETVASVTAQEIISLLSQKDTATQVLTVAAQVNAITLGAKLLEL